MDSGDKALKYLGLVDDLHDNTTSSTSLESSSSPPPQPLQQEVIIISFSSFFVCLSSMVLRHVCLLCTTFEPVH